MYPSKQLADDLFVAKVHDARAMPPSDKLFAGPRLFERSCRMAAAGLRHRFPEADEPTIQRMLEEQLAILKSLESQL
jgi:hypothetical protein